MADNRYLFRDEYKRDEKIDRIRVGKFRTEEEPLVQEILEEADLDINYLLENEKWDFLEEISDRVEQDRFDQFIDSMFEKHGEKGDQFNIQFYVVDELEYDLLVDKATEREGDELTYLEGEDFRRPTTLSKVRTDAGEDIVDLQFEVVDHPEDIEAEGLQRAMTEDGDFIDLSETELEDAERLIRENRYTIEVRAYVDDGFVGISNSVGRDSIQNEIKDAVKRWGINT
ncbi:hypothetical protein [Halorubrum vacuolatum]|nr:hypothetical protein [Halorubrum vacuolatum]